MINNFKKHVIIWFHKKPCTAGSKKLKRNSKVPNETNNLSNCDLNGCNLAFRRAFAKKFRSQNDKTIFHKPALFTTNELL